MPDHHSATDSRPLTADELSPRGDPRYIGLNRAQRRAAIAAERKAFRKTS